MSFYKEEKVAICSNKEQAKMIYQPIYEYKNEIPVFVFLQKVLKNYYWQITWSDCVRFTIWMSFQKSNYRHLENWKSLIL